MLHLTNKGLFELAVPLFTRIERPLKQAVYDSDVPAEEISRARLAWRYTRARTCSRHGSTRSWPWSALRVAAEGSDYVRDYLRVDLRFCKQLEF